MASNSNLTGIPVRFTLTKQATACVPPSVIEALENADFRIDLPVSQLDVDNVKVSTLPDNLIRLDLEGGLYAAATQVVELTEQTVTIGDATGPNIVSKMIFIAPEVTSIQNAFPAVYFTYTPETANIRQLGPSIENGNIVYTFFRPDDGSTGPFPVVTIRGSGRVFIFPAPANP